MKFLALADLHLREKKPLCRPDEENWLKTQKDTVEFIAETAENNKVDAILLAGDVFDMWDNSMFFLNTAFEWLKRLSMNVETFAIPGNHDLHSTDLNLIEYSPYELFRRAGLYTNPECAWFLSHYLHFDKDPKVTDNVRPICMVHKCLYVNDKPFASASDDGEVATFVKKFIQPGCKLVVSGDNHKPFVVQVDGVTVVNCGSVFRLRRDQKDYKPAVWICDVGETVKVKPVYIPIKYQLKTVYADANTDELVGNVSGDFEVGCFSDNYRNLVDEDEDKPQLIDIFNRTLK